MAERRGGGGRWVVVAACTLMMFTVWGMGNHPLSLYVVPVTAHHGFGRAAFSMIFSILNLMTAFANLLFGPLSRRLGVKRLMAVGGALCVGGYALFCVGGALPVYYLGAGLFGMSVAFTANNPLPIVVGNWFRKHRGTVIGLVFAASGVGGTLCDILVGRLIETRGFRVSFLWQTALIAGLLLVALLFLRERPSSSQQVPEAQGSGGPVGGTAPAEGAGKGIPWRTPSFWLLGVTLALWGMAVIPMMTTIPAWLSDCGLDPLFVSGTVMAALYAVSAVAKFGMGVISDRLGPSVMVALAGGSVSAAAVALTLVGRGAPAMLVSLLMGIGFSALTVPLPLLTAHIFGAGRMAALIGLYNAVLTFAGALATPLGNLVFDRTGTYLPVYLTQAVLTAASVVTGLLAIRLARGAATPDDQSG